MNNNYNRIIGIDLGTTYSAVAVWDRHSEKAVVLPNTEDPQFPMTTPSVISLDARTRKVIVGRPAKNNLPNEPLNTIVEIKREMGENCRFPTETDRGNMHLYSAGEYYQQQLALGLNVVPFHVRLDGKWFRPQEISAFILMKMKEIAEKAIGEKIFNAVITVPAYFTERQNSATKEAALLAGLYPLQLIPEPTAAAICYGVEKWEPNRKVYLVYDLGGGTFDVSIITVEEQNINVLATSGDPRLGGGDFDDVITDWAIKELMDTHHVDVSDNPRAKAVIKLRAEQTKIDLSTYDKATLNLLDLWPQNPPVLELTRQKFVELIGKALLPKSLNYVDMAIKAAQEKGVGRDDIDAILMVGGSSKIPCVKEQLLDYFQKGEEFLRVDLNPDAVVACGAAIMAVRYQPQPGPFDISRKVDNVLLSTEADQVVDIRQITGHSLSVGIQDNQVSRLIDQGTNIPHSVTKGSFTNPAFAQELICPIYQGEGKFQHENTMIGSLCIGPMEPKPEGFHQFEVTFTLDISGLLTVTVFHRNDNKRYQKQLDQKTGVPENDMKTVYNKLQHMYSTGEAPIPPSPFTTPGGAGAGGQQVAPTMPPPLGPMAAQAMPVPSYQPPAPTSNDAGAAEINVPAEFKLIVNRSRNLLATQPDPRLKQALDALLTALSNGASDGQLSDLGDALADVYDDVRSNPSGFIAADREIPDQFKQSVRRAQKLLIKQPDARLLEALNLFIAELNRGGTEDDLVKFGDALADVFDEVRGKVAP